MRRVLPVFEPLNFSPWPMAGFQFPDEPSGLSASRGERVHLATLTGLHTFMSGWCELDCDGGAEAEQVGFAADGDLQRGALVDEVVFLVVGEPDPDLASAESE